MWDETAERLYPTAYEKEQALFAEMKRDLQKRKLSRWRVWLGLLAAGRRGRTDSR